MFSKLKFLALSCTSLLAIYLGFFALEPYAVKVVKHAGYWLLLAAFLLAIHAGYRIYMKSSVRLSRQSIKNQRTPLLTIALLSVILPVLQENGYKIVMDEPVMASTALRMHHEKQAMVANRGYNIGGTFNILGGHIDKRPSFYPFLVSILHDLTGYRGYQGVVLNHLLTPVFLGLLFLLGNCLGGRLAGYSALALAVTIPLMAMNVSGAGFELLNLVMILATILAGMMYLRRPEEDDRMNLLVLLAVLLAQTRYESATFVVSVIGIILVAWIRQRRMQITWVSVIVPLLLICVPLQQTVLEEYPRLWQLDQKGAETPFALAYIPENLVHALNYFFTLVPIQPGSPLLSGLYCAALIVGLFLVLRGKLRSFLKREDTAAPLWVFALILANFMLLMAYHWGQIDDIMATRIAMPFLLFQILFLVTIVYLLPGARKIYLLIIAAAGLFFLLETRPETARNDYLITVKSQREVPYVLEKVRELKGQDILFITDVMHAVMPEQEAAATAGYVARNKPGLDLHLKLGTFSDVIIFYKVVESEPGNGDWAPRDPVEKDFDIEVLEEVKVADTLYIRMGRVRGVIFRESDPPPYGASVLKDLDDPDKKLSTFAKTLP